MAPSVGQASLGATVSLDPAREGSVVKGSGAKAAGDGADAPVVQQPGPGVLAEMANGLHFGPDVFERGAFEAVPAKIFQ